MGKRYKSRQLLPFSGRIYVELRITDHNGNWSFQQGVSYQGNLERTFKLGISEAITNALYKHFHRFHRPILKSDNVSLSDFIRDYDLKDWYIMYITEDERYTFKSRTINKKRYLDIRYKGKYYKRVRSNYQSRKKVDKVIQGLL